jgi:hypothetical protein
MASGGRPEHCLLWVPSRSQGGGDGAVLVRLARHPVGADRRSAAGICRRAVGTPIGTDRPFRPGVIAERDASLVARLFGRRPESVISIDWKDEEWCVGVEVVEVSRIIDGSIATREDR